MAKAADREMEISGVRLVSKSGGRSGDYHRGGEMR
jgi:cyclic pyranopterin phosphate synthase